MSFLDGLAAKNPLAMQEMHVQLLGQEEPLEKELTTHSSILAWEIPRTEEPGELLSMGLQRVGHDLVTKQQQQQIRLQLIYFLIGSVHYFTQ